jgi:hypothetical protein
VSENTEPPIGFEPRYAPLLRSPTVYETLGALNAFKRLGGPSDQSCPFERVEELIKDLQELIKYCPRYPKCVLS